MEGMQKNVNTATGGMIAHGLSSNGATQHADDSDLIDTCQRSQGRPCADGLAKSSKSDHVYLTNYHL